MLDFGVNLETFKIQLSIKSIKTQSEMRLLIFSIMKEIIRIFLILTICNQFFNERSF